MKSRRLFAEEDVMVLRAPVFDEHGVSYLPEKQNAAVAHHAVRVLSSGRHLSGAGSF